MTNKQADIFHVTTVEGISTAKQSGSYECESLQTEGFIHCCRQEQLAGVLERYYQGASNLQLLEIVSDKLDAKLVYENTMGGDELFPHIYGPINMNAVIAISVVEPGNATP